MAAKTVARACPQRFNILWAGAAVAVLAGSQLACTGAQGDSVIGTRAEAGSARSASPARQSGQAVGHQAGLERHADFGSTHPSNQARQIADGILLSHDHGGADFVIIDKKEAALYVFAADGKLRGASAVLLGSALGDDSSPNIGTRPIAEVRPEERTTPAGRFVAEPGKNTLGEDVVWVDYDAAVSMHRVRATNPAERRLERLATPSAQDNRISYGCINIPVAFYEAVVAPTFAAQRAVVYVLPEVRHASQVFPFYAGTQILR